METLQALWEVADKSGALRLESRIKRLSAEEKRRLISRPEFCCELIELDGLRPVPAGDWEDFSPIPDPNT